MANANGKAVDKTHLSLENATKRGFLHRDYIAHCLRWSHVIKHMGKKQLYKTARVLDIGCGKEMPLAKSLYSSRMAPAYYLGVDVNKLEVPEMFANAKWQPDVLGQMDICDYNSFEHAFDVITCFEVIEHVEPEHAIRILKKIKHLLSVGGHAFVSTPDFCPHTGAAANHVNEMTMEALGWVIEECGFAIEDYWGTFASQREYKHLVSEAGISPEAWVRLSEYYDSNVLATVLAPLFPHHSRNVLWKLTKAGEDYKRKFDHIDYQPKPWSSSEHQEDLRNV